MDFQSIAKVSPNGHVSEELCRQILSRLPVKSLLRFCCVSKSWLSLIKDPDFRCLHLQNLKNNHDETHLLVVQGRSRDCVVRWSDNFQINSGTLLTLGTMYGDESWSIKCSIHGLVLLESESRRKRDLRIWNPSIRKFHDIPTAPKHPENETHHRMNLYQETVIGLGYDAVVKDYKYVKIRQLVVGRIDSSPLPFVAVYTLGAGSWKTIPFQAKEGCSDSVWSINSIRDTVYLQGNLYFLVLNLEGEVWELGWFDVSSEAFCSKSLPEYLAGWLGDPDRCGIFRLVRYGCSALALMINDGIRGLTMSLFDSKSMLWTELCDLGLFVPDFLHLKKNGDILIWWSGKAGSFSLATRKSLVCDFSLVSSCNLVTKEEKILLTQELEGPSSVPCEVYGYFESLVLL